MSECGELKGSCPICGGVIEAKDIEIGRITEEYVEIEMWCDSCEDVVAFTRIRMKDWLQVAEWPGEMKA